MDSQFNFKEDAVFRFVFRIIDLRSISTDYGHGAETAIL